MGIDKAFLASLKIEPLDRKKHDRAAFSCGAPQVDNLFKNNLAKHQDVDCAKVFVAVDANEKVCGFYSLNVHSVDASDLDFAIKGFPHASIPSIYISVFGVSSDLHGQGVGSILMADTLKRCLLIAENAGSNMIVLDALDEKAEKFYQKLGFHNVNSTNYPSRMMISMKKVRASCPQPVGKQPQPNGAA